MKNKFLLFLAVGLGVLVFTIPAFSQVSKTAGSIYAKAQDEKANPLPGVTVTAESDVTRPQVATTGASGIVRFTGLPPGTYSVTFDIQGYTQVRQEEVQITAGFEAQITAKMQPAVGEQVTVIAETPLIDTKSNVITNTYTRDKLDKVPSARDPWTIIDQTPGIQTDRINVAGSESGQQSGFNVRGSSQANTSWNYDGVIATDPFALGGSPGYYDFESFEEMQVTTGGSDVSAGAGVNINIVTKRPGNKVEAEALYTYVDDKLQGENTPEELKALGQTKANHITKVTDYSLNIGGPIVKDKLFGWIGYRKSNIGLILAANAALGTVDQTQLKNTNGKASFNENQANETEYTFSRNDKIKSNREHHPGNSTVDTLWQQGGATTISPNWHIIQHTFIPNDHTFLTARWGTVPVGFFLAANGGVTSPMLIFLHATPRYQGTYVTEQPIDRTSQDFNADFSLFKDNWMGGNHEFKIGFDHRHTKTITDIRYGSGAEVIDLTQTDPNGPLAVGILDLIPDIISNPVINYNSVYGQDTVRWGGVTLNLGARFDNSTGFNQAGSKPGTGEIFQGVSYAGILNPVVTPKIDPGITFNTISPRVGIVDDVFKDGKMVARASYARYKGTWNAYYTTYSSPTSSGTSAYAIYANANGDRIITPDELITPFYYGGGALGPNIDLNSFKQIRAYDPNLKADKTDEIAAGLDRQLAKDMAISVDYVYRKYGDFIPSYNPANGIAGYATGISPSDYCPAQFNSGPTKFGSFTEPYFVYCGPADFSGRPNILTNVKDRTNIYNGVDINFRKQMSHNFQTSFGVNIQRQHADYQGGKGDSLADQYHAFDPSDLDHLDGKPYAFNAAGSGKSNVFAYSEWGVKGSAIYELPFDASVGTFLKYQQGFPYLIWATVDDNLGITYAYSAGSKAILLEDVGSRRFGNVFTLDVSFQKRFNVGNYGKFIFSADFFNLTNSNTVLNRRNDVTAGPTFGGIVENISPRAVRFGARFQY